MPAKPQRTGERGARQRAQRRGLSLRKIRASGGAARHAQYWLVVPGANSVLVGGDTGLPLHEIVAWLSLLPEPRRAAA